MSTHKKPASDAGKLLRDPKTPPRVREVAASDLAQAKKRPGSIPSPFNKKRK